MTLKQKLAHKTLVVSGNESSGKKERFLWELLGSMFSTPVADTPIMVVVNTVDNPHLTRTIDLKGGECNNKLPAVGDQVLTDFILIFITTLILFQFRFYLSLPLLSMCTIPWSCATCTLKRAAHITAQTTTVPVPKLVPRRG